MKSESFLKRALLVSAGCAALFTAPIGQAGVLNSTGLFGQGVTITYLNSDAGTTAGAFTGATFDALGIPDFWCIDITHHVGYPPNGWPYSGYTRAPFQTSPALTFSGSQVSALETLFSLYGSTAENTVQDAAAFQIAIWSILFDDDSSASNSLSTTGATGFGVTAGNAPAATLTQAQNEILAAVNGPQATFSLDQLTSGLTSATQDATQDFIVKGPPRFTTPEPTGLALLGAALVSMVFVRRRKIGGRPV